MTYRLSTDPDPPTWEEALAYLREAGLDPAGTMPLADALYRLVGPDPRQVKPALDLLRLVEAVMREKLGPIIIGEYAPGEWEITLHDEDSQDCPRFFGEDLAQAVSATASALEEQRELERTDCRILGGVP